MFARGVNACKIALGREVSLDRTVGEVEAEHIRNVLASAGGNKTRAAEMLGIDRKTLREKLRSSASESA